MFELIDYREVEFSDGCSGQIDYLYRIKNINTGEAKWINEYEYDNIRYKGLLKR